jgi:hypothetical protein
VWTWLLLLLANFVAKAICEVIRGTCEYTWRGYWARVLAPPKPPGFHRLLRRSRKPSLAGYIWRWRHRKSDWIPPSARPGYRPKWWRTH